MRQACDAASGSHCVGGHRRHACRAEFELRNFSERIEGAGILTSLTKTSGLAEISETITSVAPGDSMPYLPYQMLF
jgi:hypothetical protein